MKLILYILIFCVQISTCFSQDKGKFKVSFEFTKNKYAMERLNNFLLDTLYNGKSDGIFDTIPTDIIKNGKNVGLSILYKPLKFQSFGIYGAYQRGKLVRHGQLENYPDYPEEKIIAYIDYTYYTEAIVSGLISQTLLDELFFDNSSSFWQQADLIFEVEAGFGFSKFYNKYLTTVKENSGTTITQGSYYNFNSLDFHGRISMNFECLLTKSPLISSLGFKAGYQFLQTKNIRNDAGDVITYSIGGSGKVYQVKSNLDFSGFFAGLYFTIGK